MIMVTKFHLASTRIRVRWYAQVRRGEQADAAANGGAGEELGTPSVPPSRALCYRGACSRVKFGVYTAHCGGAGCNSKRLARHVTPKDQPAERPAGGTRGTSRQRKVTRKVPSAGT